MNNLRNLHTRAGILWAEQAEDLKLYLTSWRLVGVMQLYIVYKGRDPEFFAPHYLDLSLSFYSLYSKYMLACTVYSVQCTRWGDGGGEGGWTQTARQQKILVFFPVAVPFM